MQEKEWGDNFTEGMIIANQSSFIFAIILTIVLLICKLSGVFVDHWIWVFIPIIVRIALAVFAIVLSFIIGVIAEIKRRR